LSATEKTAVDTLVKQMKLDGIWTPMKAIYPMVGASAAACAQNLKSSSFTGGFSATGIGYSSNGVQPNDVNGFLDTNLNMSSQLLANSNHISYYSRTAASLNLSYEFGAANGTSQSYYSLFRDSGAPQPYFSVNGVESPSNWNSVANSDGSGFFINNRQSSTIFQAVRNSSILGTNTAINTGTMPNLNLFFFKINPLNVYGGRECAFASVGDGLTNQNLLDFNTAVQSFQTALSRNV